MSPDSVLHMLQRVLKRTKGAPCEPSKAGRMGRRGRNGASAVLAVRRGRSRAEFLPTRRMPSDAQAAVWLAEVEALQ